MTHPILAAWIIGGFIICNTQNANPWHKNITFAFGIAIIFFCTLLGQV